MATTTPNMGLKTWDLLADTFSHTDLRNNFLAIDTHDHTSTKGVPVGAGGIANLAVGTAQLQDLSVSTAKHADLSVTAGKLATSAVTGSKLDDTTVGSILGFGSTRRGKSIIATTESTSATTYSIANLATPDRVQNIVLPTDGLIAVGYQALWQNTVAGNARAAIFIGNNQARVAPSGSGGGAPGVQEATGNSTVNADTALASTQIGIFSNAATANTTDVATGQIISENQGSGGVMYIFAAAGTYDISVQFKNNAPGTLTVKNRHLWVWTQGF